jgi:hypothetical protein
MGRFLWWFSLALLVISGCQNCPKNSIDEKPEDARVKRNKTFEFRFISEKSTYRFDDVFRFAIDVRNISGKPDMIRFSSGQVFEFKATDAKGNTAFSSQELMYTMALQMFELAPDQSHRFDFQFNLAHFMNAPLISGSYTLVVSLAGQGFPEFISEFSIVEKGR